LQINYLKLSVLLYVIIPVISKNINQYILCI